MTATGRRAATVALGAAVVAAATGAALAHGSERGFVLTMPTGFVLAGGTAAVAISFLAMLALPDRVSRRLLASRRDLGRLPALPTTAISTAVFALLVLLIVAGFTGTRDPLGNPLPLAVWTVWWVGLPLASALVGNAWAVLNPFPGPLRLLDRASGGRLSAARRPLPAGWGYAPAIALYLAFAWFELVYPAPDDPERLAIAVSGYVVLTLLMGAVFGADWFERGDPFAAFFRIVSGVAPLQVTDGRDGRRLVLVPPGAGLADRPPLPWSGILFILIILSTNSFDGLSKTFLYLGALGVNPLEYPGRTAMVGANTAGLIAAAICLAGLFVAAVEAGRRSAGGTVPLRDLAGRLVLSIVPISVAFHFAHYLVALLVNGQYAVVAAGDPFGTGRNLFGLDDHDVVVSFLATRSGTLSIWAAQTAAIVAGHVLAVAVAHGLLVGWRGDLGKVAAAETPLALAMVFYTAFGLWLLSTPVTG